MTIFAEMVVQPLDVVAWAVAGLAAGWFVWLVMKGSTGRLVGDMIAGLLGAMVGGAAASLLGEEGTAFLGSVVAAFLGGWALVIAARAAAVRLRI